MKGLVVLIGKSGSGKTYLESQLCYKYPDMFYKIVSFTTREKRSNEIDGVNYHFVTENQYKDNLINGNVFQDTVFAGNNYGSFNNEFKKFTDKYGVIVAAPSDSFVVFLEKYKTEINKPVYLVYFDISQDLAISNMISRGDSSVTITKRVDSDDVDLEMTRLGLTPDLLISDEHINIMLPEHFKEWLKERRC